MGTFYYGRKRERIDVAQNKEIVDYIDGIGYVAVMLSVMIPQKAQVSPAAKNKILSRLRELTPPKALSRVNSRNPAKEQNPVRERSLQNLQ